MDTVVQMNKKSSFVALNSAGIRAIYGFNSDKALTKTLSYTTFIFRRAKLRNKEEVRHHEAAVQDTTMGQRLFAALCTKPNNGPG